MSSVPKPDKKPKYNNNAPYEWVDSQWEKFMVQQKEDKAMIKQLREDLVTCNEHFQRQRKQMQELVSRVPSSYLTHSNERTDEWRIGQFNRNRSIEDQVSTIEEMEEKVKELFFHETKYVYERNPNTGQVYRRAVGNYENKVPVDDDLNPIPEQLNLFDE